MTNILSTKPNTWGAKRVFVGLSGGVDSGVSAALLKDKGYEVTGVFIKIQIPGYPCTAKEDRIEAMRVAAHLRIPFIEIDLSKEYEAEVFRPSVEEFKKGRTPNPDTLCNEKIKFGVFYEFVRNKGADFVATGHYAQIKNGLLYQGVDPAKDQSYFLWAAGQKVLAHTLFPVGGMQKSEVRALAEKFGLPNSKRKDSQGLCFLGDISIGDMLRRETNPIEGKVLGEQGETIGTHGGASLYTLGQRHGFELFAKTSSTQAHFVIVKNVEANTITVSTTRFPKGKTKTHIILKETNWIGEVKESSCEAQYRYHGERIVADLQRTVLKGNSEGPSLVMLKTPHYVPQGQSLVLYSGERCLGGGVVESVTLE